MGVDGVLLQSFVTCIWSTYGAYKRFDFAHLWIGRVKWGIGKVPYFFFSIGVSACFLFGYELMDRGILKVMGYKL